MFGDITAQIDTYIYTIYAKTEVWRKIRKYPRYSVSSFGNIRVDDSGLIKNQIISTEGYKY